MAGQPKRSGRKGRKGQCSECKGMSIPIGQVKKEQAERASLRLEVKELREIVANTRPSALVARQTETLSDYYPELCDKVIASGIIGKSPDEVRASLGITKRLWTEWRVAHDAFADAADLHRTHCRAFWLSKAREAMTEGNWQFQTDKVERLLEQLFKGEDLDALGDASTLIKITDAPYKKPR